VKFPKSLIILAILVLPVLILVPAAPVIAQEPTVQLVLGESGPIGWEIGPILPGQSGNKTVTVQNAGSQPGNLSVWFSNIRNIDGTLMSSKPIP
jgi:hypothetical protein